MPWRKIKNIEIGKTPSHIMCDAIRNVVNGGLSAKAAAVKYNIPRTTLRRYIKKCKEKQEEIDWNSPILEGAPRLTPNYNVNQIFSSEEESILSDYFQIMAKLHHGMNPKCARKLAYDLAVANKKKIPVSWTENRTAGRLWFNGFMKRQKELSIRSAEATSLGRAMGFNKPVIQQFFNNLQQIFDKYKLGPEQVYNVDETALSTVQETGKVLARKGQKQVGHITSSERGTLVTMCGCINALGNNVPPMLVFPRKNFKDYMLKNAPPGTVGAASPSGWMTTEIFTQWLNHFIKHSKPTSESPVLLIMDNHETHVSLDSIKLAKQNNVILLTIPPHTSHKIQPLDKSVYFPLKKLYNQTCQTWLLNHPGRRITIYDIAEILGESYPLAFSPRNCVSGFRSTGIYPFNSNIFSDEDFMAATVTDTQRETNETVTHMQHVNEKINDDANIDLPDKNMPSTSMTSRHVTPERQFIPPSVLKPFPSAVLGSVKVTTRKKRKTEILTSTPVLENLETEEKMKESRKSNLKKRPIVKRNVDCSNHLIKSAKKQAKSYKENENSSSDSDVISEMTDSDEVDWCPELDPRDAEFTVNDMANIDVGSFVLVKFATKKLLKYYVGRVMEMMEDTNEFNVSFLRRHGNSFTYPYVLDTGVVPINDIELHLPDPSKIGGTNRTANSFSFPINLAMYNVH